MTGGTVIIRKSERELRKKPRKSLGSPIKRHLAWSAKSE
jgi:hypothetical protein